MRSSAFSCVRFNSLRLEEIRFAIAAVKSAFPLATISPQLQLIEILYPIAIIATIATML